MTDQNFESDVRDLEGDRYEEEREAIEAMNLENNTVMVVETEFYPGSKEVVSYRLHKKFNDLWKREVYYILATYPITGDKSDFFAYENLEEAIHLLGVLVEKSKVVNFRTPRRS